jgi:hypothetical protein
MISVPVPCDFIGAISFPAIDDQQGLWSMRNRKNAFSAVVRVPALFDFSRKLPNEISDER